MIKLLVGLGNPGPEYDATRHNAGFWWVDALAHALKVPLHMDKGYHGLVARTTVDGHTVWLLEPQTFMNGSGKSVAALARFFKIAPQEILVVHDELDIVPGEAKLKLGGSHAGHNGLRDIHAQLGTGDYWRLRLGVGHPGVKAEVVDWVLKKPSQDHRIAIEQAIDRTLKALPHLLAGEMDKATMLVHTSKPPRPKLPKPPTPPVTAAGTAATATVTPATPVVVPLTAPSAVAVEPSPTLHFSKASP
jgi:peptidyl-tRNA hydrolase, PTH1 family